MARVLRNATGRYPGQTGEKMNANKLVSIVIPVYNEEAVLPELYAQLLKTVEPLEHKVEIIFIDDGSKDNSWRLINDFYLKHKDKIRAVQFSRNFGHQAALTAGMDFARGDCIITMDADLQHPPEMIPRLLEKWEEGNEVVYTIREKTGKETLLKRVTSNLFYKLFHLLAQIEMESNTADFRLLDRKVVDSLKQMRERARFLRGMISWVGYKQTGIRYTAVPRYAGRTKYTLRKMIYFALDGITSFSAVPLRITFVLGLIVTFFASIYAVYAVIVKLILHQAVKGWTSLMLVVLIMGGIQLITLGILGEYMAKNFQEVKRRPIYIATDSLGIGDA